MTLKVVFFGDNVPKERADISIEAAKECDAFLVLGSSVMTMSAYRLVRCISLFFFLFLFRVRIHVSSYEFNEIIFLFLKIGGFNEITQSLCLLVH